MRRTSLGLMLLMLMCSFMSASFAKVSEPNPWFSRDAKNETSLRVDVFVTSDCPNCQKILTFLKSTAKQNPWLNIQYYVINQDKAALLSYFNVLKLKNLQDFAVPSVFFCNARWVGFKNAESSGKSLLANLNYCRQEVTKEGTLTHHTEQMLKQMSYAHWSQENFDKAMPDWMIILGMAFFDSMSPETLFIILTLLCFMRIETKTRLKVTSFVLFLIGVGGGHYFQQMYPEQFYATLQYARLPTMLIGLGLLLYLFVFHPKVFANRKPLPAALTLLWLLLTGLAVQWYQQLHMPNFSLSFLQWMLAKENLVTYGAWLYPWMYQFAYVIFVGLATSLLFVVLVFYGKWTRHQMLVDEFSWQYLIIIGLILVVYPYVFAEQAYALLTVVAALLTSWLSYRFWSKKHPDEHLK